MVLAVRIGPACASFCQSVCVFGLTAACAGSLSPSPPAVRFSVPVAGASTPSDRSAGLGVASTVGAVRLYVAESATEVPLSLVRELTWPPELSDGTLPAACLGRRQPLARTCRYPGVAVQRLSEILLDAYQVSHHDPEQPVCESTRKTRDKAGPLPTLADRQRALDKDLAELEGCDEFPPGFARALRAHEDPECADALAQIPLEAGVRRKDSAPSRAHSSSRPTAAEPQRIDEFWHDLLYGQALAAVFDRWFRHPLTRLDSPDPAKIEVWRNRVLLPYFAKGQTQLENAWRAVGRLPDESNGRAVAGHALWQAEFRMMRNARMVQIPDKLKKDYRSRTSFYGRFDEVTQSLTEARERHGLSDCLLRADHGWLDDVPLFSKRSAIASEVEPRCSRFTQLPLPFPLAPRSDPRQSSDPILRLATALPPAFVDALLSDERRVDPEIHRALLTRGTPRSVRQFASAALASGHAALRQHPDLHLALARSEFRLGLYYFAPQSFERSKHELEFAPDTGETRLLRALTETLLTVRPTPSPDSPRGTCLGFDTSALRNFLDRSTSESKDVTALAASALARLAFECPQNENVQNIHTMLDQAQAGGAFYLLGCWYDKMSDARPFSVERLFDCGDPRSYRCLTIPWQGR
jgi:hypothetical protein